MWAVKHFRHYLYGYQCTMFTDHEVLKSLLNTSHLSGKLVRWGMALQELDLKIEYRPGRGNKKADALSCHLSTTNRYNAYQSTPAVVATLEASNDSAKVSRITLSEKQRLDPYLRLLTTLLDDHASPENDQKARELVLGWAQYTMIEGVLELDKTSRVVVPVSDRENLFKEAHSGKCEGHLREVKIHSS